MKGMVKIFTKYSNGLKKGSCVVKKIKKLFSMFLSVLMLFTCFKSVFASGGISNNIKDKNKNVLVIGKTSSQKKFLRILFDENTDRKIGVYHYYEKFNFAVTLDYIEKSKLISEYIKNNLIQENLNEFKFHVILATIDVDQDVENVKSEIENIVDFICDYKQPYVQVLIVGCKESDSEIDLSVFSNYAVEIERFNTKKGWGTKHDISFSGTGQFLSFFSFYKNTKNDIFKFIFELDDDYYFYKKKNQSQCTIS